MRGLALLIGLCALTASSAAADDCAVYWRYVGGKEDPEYLSIKESWPLPHFARNEPWWYYGDNLAGDPRDTQKGRLQWNALDRPANVRALGRVGGLSAYEITYSPLSRAIVWDRGGGKFCPALIVSGDASLVVGIHEARVFDVQGADLVHVRLQFTGTGHFQESIFLAKVEGALGHVRNHPGNEKTIADFYARHHMKESFKGLGFCENSLTEERLYETLLDSGHWATQIGSRVVLHYRLEAGRMRIADFGFTDAEHDCEMFPRWPAGSPAKGKE